MIFCDPFYLRGGWPESALYDSAREYAANLFNWCAAQRDYSYSQHAEPKPHACLLHSAAKEIRARVLREWQRSNL